MPLLITRTKFADLPSESSNSDTYLYANSLTHSHTSRALPNSTWVYAVWGVQGNIQRAVVGGNRFGARRCAFVFRSFCPLTWPWFHLHRLHRALSRQPQCVPTRLCRVQISSLRYPSCPRAHAHTRKYPHTHTCTHAYARTHARTHTRTHTLTRTNAQRTSLPPRARSRALFWHLRDGEVTAVGKCGVCARAGHPHHSGRMCGSGVWRCSGWTFPAMSWLLLLWIVCNLQT